MCKQFNQIKREKDCVEFLNEHVSQHTYSFDGYEEYPSELNKRFGTYRKFYDPRYNMKTKYYVASHGGRQRSEKVLVESLKHVYKFWISPAEGVNQEDALILEAVNDYGTCYIKIFNRIVNGVESPVVVFHN